jgi:hypothetical protein
MMLFYIRCGAISTARNFAAGSIRCEPMPASFASSKRWREAESIFRSVCQAVTTEGAAAENRYCGGFPSTRIVLA